MTSETQMEPLSFQVQGKFIMDLARKAYWFELRRPWAKALLGELQGITEEQIMKILNGDAVLTGWARGNEQIMYSEKPDKKYKKVIAKRMEFVNAHMIEVIPDRFVGAHEIRDVMFHKLVLGRFIDKNSNAYRLFTNQSESTTRIKQSLQDEGFTGVEDSDVADFLNAIKKKFNTVDVARLKQEVNDAEIRSAKYADIRDLESPEAKQFIEALDKLCNRVHDYERHPTGQALDWSVESIFDDRLQERLARERNIEPVKMVIEGVHETQELFDCPNVSVGIYEIPEELVYKYAAVIRSSGADRVAAHTRIFKWLALEHEAVRRFFSIKQTHWEKSDGGGTVTTYIRENDEESKAKALAKGFKPVVSYRLRPDDINIEIAQKVANELYNDGRVFKKPDETFTWFVGETLATNSEAAEIFKCEIALDHLVRAILEDRTKSIANRRKWERYNGDAGYW